MKKKERKAYESKKIKEERKAREAEMKRGHREVFQGDKGDTVL